MGELSMDFIELDREVEVQPHFWHCPIVILELPEPKLAQSPHWYVLCASVFFAGAASGLIIAAERSFTIAAACGWELLEAQHKGVCPSYNPTIKKTKRVSRRLINVKPS